MPDNNLFPFIGREKELGIARKAIDLFGSQQFVFVSGVGGIGKTRFLQEIEVRTEQRKNIIFPPIIDFDDYENHVSQNIDRKLATELSLDIFAPYLKGLVDYRKMEMSGVSSERLAEEQQSINENFLQCFNQFTQKNRVVLRLDTIDAIDSEENILLNRLLSFGLAISNIAFFVAGRKADDVFQNMLRNGLLDKEKSQGIKLPPLNPENSESYLQIKQERKGTTIGREVRERLIKISKGRSIFIDLAVEWVAHDIPLDWLLEMPLTQLDSLVENEQETQEFEKNLVSHIAETRNNMDWVILLLAIDFPSTPPIISEVLGISLEEATTLFEETKEYAFVKVVGRDDITLHDEMRRLVLTYAWPIVDPQFIRMRRYREKIIGYLDKKIDKSAKESYVSLDAENFFFLEEQKHKLWMLQRRRLMHYLILDSSKGVKEFARLYDDVAEDEKVSFREVLVSQLDRYLGDAHLSDSDRYKIDIRRASYYLDRQDYSRSYKIIETLFTLELDANQKTELELLKGNLQVRLSKVNDALITFEKALQIAKTENPDIIWLMKANNALGWAYRLQGYHQKAYGFYNEAMRLCEENDILEDDYGFLLNNITYVMSLRNRTAGIDYGKMAVEYWKGTDNLKGLGMAYQVLGTAFYQNGLYTSAEDVLNKALDIFSHKLELDEWEGRVLSWRGTLYQYMDKLDLAEADLIKALELGSRDTHPMTFNRLGRVYMSKRNWEKAKENLQKSYDISLSIPDYVYYLSSLSRLITVAAEEKKYKEFDKFEKELIKALGKVDMEEVDKNALGVAYFGLGRLALGDSKTEEAEQYLVKGIENIVEFGVYARKGVRERLAYVENNFSDISPDVVQKIASNLLDTFSSKAEKPGQEIYGVVLSMLRRWKNGKVTENEI